MSLAATEPAANGTRAPGYGPRSRWARLPRRRRAPGGAGRRRPRAGIRPLPMHRSELMSLNDKVTAGHLARKAYLYIRQSTVFQVEQNPESTRRQYRFQEQAVALG